MGRYLYTCGNECKHKKNCQIILSQYIKFDNIVKGKADKSTCYQLSIRILTLENF